MMKIFSRFKFLSRAVAVHEEHVGERNKYPISITEGSLCTSLTVWRKSLLVSCKGFTVIDSYGNLVYRVDNYILHPDELVLMDASGNSVLTMRRNRKLGLADSWVVYEGEEMGNQRKLVPKQKESPVFWVKKNVNILNGNPKVQACVYRVGLDSDKRHLAFTVEGSYANRTCKVLDECKGVVAEIKKKEANSKDASFGLDIFHLIIYPGFDPAFAMAIVLLLDRMFS